MTPTLEHPAAGGPQLRIENSIKALKNVCDLDLFVRVDSEQILSDETKNFFKPYCGHFIIAPWIFTRFRERPVLRKALRLLSLILPLQTRHEANSIIEHADKMNIKIIWIAFGNISYSLIRRLRRLRPDLKLICDTDSIWSRFILRELPYAHGLRKIQIWFRGKWKEHEEKTGLNNCDITTAVSSFDGEYYQSLCENTEKIRLFSNVIDLDTYANRSKNTLDIKKPSIYLAGTFGAPNSSMNVAARWFLNEVLPLVISEIPDIHFYIVGKNSNLEFGHLNGPGITVTGKIDTVLPYLLNVSVSIVPLKFESGTRFKILEAGACRIPIVSTTLGAEGIPVISDEQILIADEPEQFASSVVKIIRFPELAQQLSEKCYQLIRDHYSIETLTNEARLIFKSLERID